MFSPITLMLLNIRLIIIIPMLLNIRLFLITFMMLNIMFSLITLMMLKIMLFFITFALLTARFFFITFTVLTARLFFITLFKTAYNEFCMIITRSFRIWSWLYLYTINIIKVITTFYVIIFYCDIHVSAFLCMFKTSYITYIFKFFISFISF